MDNGQKLKLCLFICLVQPKMVGLWRSEFEVYKELELIGRTCGLWKVLQRVTRALSDIASDACPTTQGLSQPFTLPALKWKLSSSATFTAHRVWQTQEGLKGRVLSAQRTQGVGVYISLWLVLRDIKAKYCLLLIVNLLWIN